MNRVKSKKTGVVEGLYITPDKESFLTEFRNELNFEIGGISGDRHAGIERHSGGREKKQYRKGTVIRNNRQWSAMSTEEITDIALAMDLPEVKPEWMGTNLLVSGIPDFSLCQPMSLLKIFHNEHEGPVLVVFGQNKPCIHPHKLMESIMDRKIEVPFSKAAANNRGLIGWVEKPGVANVGDRVEWWLPA